MSTEYPVRLLTLGQLALRDAAGQDLLPPDASKPLALLAYLAAAPARHASRERLIDLFWGDSTADHGRSSLRQALYRLREAIGNDTIYSEGSDLQLGEALTTDRDDFLAAMDRGEVNEAIAVYVGPFIRDFVSRGTAQFEQWCDLERERLHDLFTSAVERAGERALSAGQHHLAAELAQRVLQDHPLDERGWRLRLQAEQLSGSSIHLATSIAELRRLFAAEGWQPQSRTLQLIDALERPRAMAADDDPHGTLEGDLVGRGSVMATLYRVWRGVATRNGAHVHVTGKAGLGKSRVMSDFAVRLGAERARVITVGAYPRQRFVPGALLAAVITPLAKLPSAKGISTESARILVALQPAAAPYFGTSPASDEVDVPVVAMGEALHELFEAATDDGPVCLILDDAHWWDDDSRHRLESAIERLQHRPIMVISASRPGRGEISTALTTARIELDVWQREDVVGLLDSLGSCDDPAALEELATALCRATEGVPLLVIEALRLGIDRSHIALVNRQWRFPQLTEFIALLQPGELLRERAAILTPVQRHLLLVTWLLETEITRDDLHALDHAIDDSAVVELERLGFLLPGGGGWKVAHDSIGEALEASGTVASIRDAHRDAGLLLLARGDHPLMLRQAACHGIDAGDPALLSQVASTWVRRRRRDGATQSAGQLVAEVLPTGSPAAQIRELARRLPPDIRRTPWSGRRLAPIWAIAGALAVIGGTWLGSRPLPPDTTLGILGTAPGFQERQLSLRHDSWDDLVRGVVTPVVAASNARWPFASSTAMTSTPVADPGGTRWLFSQITPTDNGLSELVLVHDRVAKVIAPAHGDDVNPSWSPDGRFAVFSTMRWAALPDGGFDLAILEVATGKVRQLTATADGDISPKWSPAGSRIGFIRQSLRPGPDSLCWRSINGENGACRTINAAVIQELAGWVDGKTVLVTTSVTTACEWQLIDVDTGNTQRIRSESSCAPSLSPDGSWVAWSNHHTATSSGTAKFRVASLRGSRNERAVDISTLAGSDATLYWIGSWSRPSISHISLRYGSDTIDLHSSYRLRLGAVDANGKAMDIVGPVVDWRSSDARVAPVDSAGTVWPRAIGTVVVSATAGGWRADSVRLVVARIAPVRLLDEQWGDTALTRWLHWGTPDSRVVNAADGSAALFVNGDGEYTSGVYSRLRIPVTRGAALDLEIETPITRSKWQFLQLGLLDARVVTPSGPNGHGCSFKYPSSEGALGIHRFSFTGGGGLLDGSLDNGQRYRIRVQLFPDGTCGIAINDVPAGRGPTGVTSRDSVSVVLGGQTVLSPLLIRRATLWSGVPTDVAWDRPPLIGAAQGNHF